MRCTFLICALLAYLGLRNVGAKRVSGDHEWDILIFTQQWPATACDEMRKHHHINKCTMPATRDSWSIHGIWPTKLGTIGPAFCNRTWLFDPEQIRPIETDLTQLWTNIDPGSQLYALWAHEWSKHGTCAAVLQPFNSEFKYFSKGLEWFKDYDMTSILDSGGISPSDSLRYKVLDIYNAIKNKLGVNPAIHCVREAGVSMIDEIRICFDKNLLLHDCDGIKTPKLIGTQAVITNCDPSQDVLYPHYPRSSIYVELYKAFYAYYEGLYPALGCEKPTAKLYVEWILLRLQDFGDTSIFL